MRQLIIIFILIILNSCANNNEQKSNIIDTSIESEIIEEKASKVDISQKEEKILNNIFPQLVDSLDIVMTNFLIPPPPPIYDNDSNYIGIDTVAEELIKAKFERVLNKIDSVDSRLLFGIRDSCFAINLKSISKRAYSNNELLKRVLSANVNSIQHSRKLNINQIDCGNDYQIVYKSELKNKYGNVWRVKDRRYGGIISISKAYFDKANKVGLVHFEILQSPRDGSGYCILLQRVDNKWLIKRIFKSWVT